MRKSALPLVLHPDAKLQPSCTQPSDRGPRSSAARKRSGKEGEDPTAGTMTGADKATFLPQRESLPLLTRDGKKTSSSCLLPVESK
mmetsp:Transcript_4549/g.17897  ORF Transcript_4549/g.17897 Transcript_4549/m.17897 type:complete len:86 (-) Transcript_4549:1356-1613(-)